MHISLNGLISRCLSILRSRFKSSEFPEGATGLKRSCVGAALVTASLLAASPGLAIPVTWGFTGTVTSASGSLEGLSELPYEEGDAFSGSYTFDYNPNRRSWLLSEANLAAGDLQITFDSVERSVSCNIPSACFSLEGGPIWDNSSIGFSPGGQFSPGSLIAILAAGPGPDYDSVDIAFEMVLVDSGGYILDPPFGDPIVGPLYRFDPENPPDLIAGSFQQKSLFAGWGEARGPGRRYWSMGGDFESLYVIPAVPEPSSALLIGLGLVALGAQRNRPLHPPRD